MDREFIKHFNHKTTTMMDIINYLNATPFAKVRLQGKEQTLTYERINDERGFMASVRCIETGETIEAI